MLADNHKKLPRFVINHKQGFNLVGLNKSVLEPKYMPTTLNERPSMAYDQTQSTLSFAK